MTPRERLSWLRTGPRSELIATVVFLGALALGVVHWIGLAVGGILVGLVAPSLKRAFVMGLYLGSIVAVAFLSWLWLSGALTKALEAPQLLAPTLAAALVLPVLGAGLRGLG